MRYSPEPPDVYLTISPWDGGVVACDPPSATPRAPKAPTRAHVKQGILDALPAESKTAVAEKLGRRLNDNSFRLAWAELEDEGEIAKSGGRWVVVIGSSRGGDDYDYKSSDLCGGCGAAFTATPRGRVCVGCFARGEGS
jgi:hypothetical protein